MNWLRPADPSKRSFWPFFQGEPRKMRFGLMPKRPSALLEIMQPRQSPAFHAPSCIMKHKTHYTEDEFADILRTFSEHPGHLNEPAQLRTELEDLLLGCYRNADEAHLKEYWKQFESGDLTTKQKCFYLQKLSRLKHPMKSTLLRRNEIYGLVSGTLGNRWKTEWQRAGRAQSPSLRSLNWTEMSEHERMEFRQILSTLAEYYRKKIPRGRPPNKRLKSILREIAEIWMSHSGWQEEVVSLTHSTTGPFIEFACDCLYVIPEFEQISPETLSKHWKDVRKAEQD
ncbi:MAG: hypothetical protein AAGF74_02790 [Pseudomonadota bacterium]